MRLFLALSLLFSISARAESLRVFTWDGYVTQSDIAAVNNLIAAKGLDVQVEVIKPFAEGPDQMFEVIRSGKADLSFLTLNYIKMQNERTAKLLQKIDISKLSNYSNVIPALTNIPMGMSGDAPLYVPWGGGAYGIWADMKTLKREELPTTYAQLGEPKWKGKLSLSGSQIQPNIAIVMLATGQSPFQIHDYVEAGQRDKATALAADGSAQANFLKSLYANVGAFWSTAPEFKDGQSLVASYGIELAGLNAKGGKWELVNFKEGNTVWLDTMNIAASVTGPKLEAAYIFMNYFLGAEVQSRVASELSMVAAVKNVKNPLFEKNSNFFNPKMFWPPYSALSDNIMKTMSDKARK